MSKTLTTRERNAQLRSAVAGLIRRNYDKIERLIEKIEFGIAQTDADGQPILDENNALKYVVRPDPKGALDSIVGLLEYQLPKLARVEHTDADGAPMAVTRIERVVVTPEQVQQSLMEMAARLEKSRAIVAAEVVDDAASQRD